MMELILLDELTQTLGVEKDFLKKLHELHLVSKPISQNEEEIIYNASIVDEITHILSLQSLGYTLQDISKILKVTDNIKGKKQNEKELVRYFTVGEVATQLNLTKRTLDFWIEKGVIKPSTTSKSGYRLFSEGALKFISFVSDLQTIGFTLEQIKTITDVIDEAFKPYNDEPLLVIDQIQNKINDNEKAIRSLKGALKIIQKNNRSQKPQ